ncbi:integrase arm-type DNA-binding domain-containing protein [Bradyrhizobium sp. CCBAU 21362]|uniref:integrase arm-type DNA-binding domain-containing protein n=1 Tax=Bradyrhizobium sp. CCBAU 21362 TaxID=1325082 RepID=UPI002FE3FEDA
MPLTDTACRSAKPKTNAYKVSDGGGLHMLVETNGSRLWRQAYRFDGKQKLIALGAYPTVSLAERRNARDANKALLAKGVDPSAQRKLDRTAARLARTNTFRIIADELVAKFEVEGDDPKTLKKKKWLVDLLCAEIGDRPIAEIAAPELLDALKKIERRGRYESARRARSLSGRIFRYAIVTGRAARDHRPTSPAPSSRRRSSIAHPSPNQKQSAPCSAPSTTLTVRPPRAPRCS